MCLPPFFREVAPNVNDRRRSGGYDGSAPVRQKEALQLDH